MRYFNKKEKTANLLFRIVEYSIIAFGINALLPKSPIEWITIFIGGIIAVITFILAILITPEKEDKK